MKKFVTVIQARYKSLRFPGKPINYLKIFIQELKR